MNREGDSVCSASLPLVMKWGVNHYRCKNVITVPFGPTVVQRCHRFESAAHNQDPEALTFLSPLNFLAQETIE